MISDKCVGKKFGKKIWPHPRVLAAQSGLFSSAGSQQWHRSLNWYLSTNLRTSYSLDQSSSSTSLSLSLSESIYSILQASVTSSLYLLMPSFTGSNTDAKGNLCLLWAQNDNWFPQNMEPLHLLVCIYHGETKWFLVEVFNVDSMHNRPIFDPQNGPHRPRNGRS